MKNLLPKIALVATLLTTSTTSLFAAANQIVLNATVAVVTVVGFADVSASTSDDTFVDPGAALDFGSAGPGETFTPITQAVFVRHNDTTTNVQMTFADGAGNSGALANGANTIAMTYTIMGNAITVDGATQTQILASGTTNAGSVSFGDFVATPAANGAAQATGAYSVTLTVVVSGV